MTRPANLSNDAMTKKELEEFRRSLSLLSPNAVREKYKQVVDRCRFMELPTPPHDASTRYTVESAMEMAPMM
jgi:hypothetical protein